MTKFVLNRNMISDIKNQILESLKMSLISTRLINEFAYAKSHVFVRKKISCSH